MSKKVLIFQELLVLLPELKASIEKRGIEIVSVGGGKDVLLRLIDKPLAIILDVAMPQMSGIECCRQIKDGELALDTKVILISSVDSSNVEEGATNAGCDFFTAIGDAGPKIFEFLNSEGVGSSSKENAELGQPIEFRVAPCVEASGTLTYEIENTRHVGELINLSRNGILFAVEAPVADGTKITIHLRDYQGDEFDLWAVAVRTVTLKERRKGMQYACGGKFTDVPASVAKKVDEFITAKSQEDSLAASLTQEYLQAILQAEPDFLNDYVTGSKQDETLHFIGDISEYEKEALSSQNPRAACVQRMVLLRVQCNVCYAFVPRVATNPQVMGALFLKELSELLTRVDSIESEIETHVKAAVAEEEEIHRVGLNETSNRLHESKMHLLFKVDDRFSAFGLGPDAASVLEQVQQRAASLQSLFQGGAQATKYSRKTLAPLPLPKAASGKAKGYKPVYKQTWFLSASTAAGLAILFVWVPYLLFSRVSENKLQIPLKFERAVKSDDGLIVYTTRADWRLLTKKQKDDALLKLQEFLQEQKLPQLEIVDENRKNLASISSSKVGQKVYFLKRINDE